MVPIAKPKAANSRTIAQELRRIVLLAALPMSLIVVAQGFWLYGLEEWETRIHPEDKPLTLATVQDYLEGRTPIYNSEHRVRCKDGSYKWILDRGLVVRRGEDGEPLRMIGTHADITESRLAAEALQRQGEQLLQRNDELDRFNRIMVGRKLDLVDLKRKVNAPSLKLGLAAPFNLAFADAPPAAPAPTSEAKDSTPPAAGAPR